MRKKETRDLFSKKNISLFMLIFLILTSFSSCGNIDKTEKTKDIFAMDTYINLKAYGPDAESAIEEASERIYNIERTLSVTEKESDVSKINIAKGKPVNVSRDTVNILETARRINEESGGALSVTIYPVLCAWGFTTGSNQIPDKNLLSELLKSCDDSKIYIDNNSITIPSGAMIDLGAITKGYAGDAVIDIMRKHNIGSAIINLGGNVQALGRKPDGSMWTVGIRDPFSPDELLGTVSVSDSAVITSGNYERYFIGNDGKRYWHILDPKDGYPADNGLVSVTVIGKNGAECDALSTALFVEGTQKAVQHWSSSGGFEMICVTKDGNLLITEGIADNYTPKNNMPLTVIHRDK
jgi:Membrane-associated lipoprotein involved in thiamine biosynthesis